MDRRFFLEKIALATGAMLMPGSLFSFNRNEESPWFPILDYARFCPSPHNIQPWKLKLTSALEAELHFDTNRLLPVADKNHRFMTIGMGLFIETMSIAAAGFGYELRSAYTGNSLSHTAISTLFAKLSLVKTNPAILFDKELIKRRRTSRLHYKPRKIDVSILEKLKAIANGFGHTANFSDDEQQVKSTIELNRDTLFHDLNDTGIREELKKWLRYSKEEAEQYKDGLWSHCMQFPGKLMRNFFNHPGFYNHGIVKKVLDRYYTKSMKGTQHIAWIQGPTESPEEQLSTGRMLLRFWLEMTRNNVCMHPFGSVITNTEAHPKLASILHLENGIGNAWLLMRIGYSDEAPASYRLTNNEILLNQKP